MKSKKVIFLDIDGVLNTKWWYSHMEKNTPKDHYGYMFDPISVGNLAKIIDATGAEIVISSSWKCIGLPALIDLWKNRNLPGKVLDITPPQYEENPYEDYSDGLGYIYNKSSEIKQWLENNCKFVSHYVIIDDMEDFLTEQQPHFVWIDPEVGITEGNAAQAIMILNHLQDAKKNTRNT